MPDTVAPPAGRALADRLALAVALVATALGVGWRLVDVTEWPFPFFDSVQYESALAARALWVAADPAARTPERAAWFAEARFGHVVSPPVLPAFVAATYAVSGRETHGSRSSSPPRSGPRPGGSSPARSPARRAAAGPGSSR